MLCCSSKDSVDMLFVRVFGTGFDVLYRSMHVCFRFETNICCAGIQCCWLDKLKFTVLKINSRRSWFQILLPKAKLIEMLSKARISYSSTAYDLNPKTKSKIDQDAVES